MGYEVKLYFGETNLDPFPGETSAYFSIVGMVDLCKIGDGKLIKLDQAAPANPLVYFYGTDGNTKYEQDRYDKNLRVYPVADVLKALRADNRRDPYRRYAIAIAALSEAAKHFKSLQIVFYAY